MKLLKMLTSPVKASIIVLAMISAEFAWADGRDSLLHWWKVQDLNGDGLLQPGEFYDVMTLGAASPKTGTTIYQATEGVDEKDLVTVETVDVYKPSMRKTVTEPVLHLHNPTNWENGVLKCNYQAVEANKSCIGRKLIDGKKEGTVFIRFKWDGRRFPTTGDSPYAYEVALYSDAYNTSSGWGWKVGFRTYDSSAPNTMYPNFKWGSTELGFYQSPHDSNFQIVANIWYDMAVTFRYEQRNGVDYMTRAVMLREGNVSNYSDRMYYYDRREGSFTPNWQSFDIDGHRISLGYHSYSGDSGGTTFVDAKSGGDNSFIGLIHEVKEYTKYMEEYELLQVMLDGDPECMIGSRNGKDTEFSDAQAEDVYEPATMDWIRMRRTLTTANPMSVKFDLAENGHGLGRLVEMRFLKESAFAGERVKISLNGRQFGSKQIPEDGEVRFFIKPGILSALQKDEQTGLYPVTLTLVRGDELNTSISLDYLTVGGSWQIFAVDNKHDDGGSTANYYNYFYSVGQRRQDQIVCSISHEGGTLYRTLDIFFGLSDWAAANLGFRLTVKSVNSLIFPAYLTVNDDTENRHVFSGLSCYEGGGTNFTYQAGQLQTGNRLNLTCDGVAGSKSWDSFDYWRLEALMPEGFKNSDEGLTIILK